MKAAILAAGLGTRLRPLTYTLPKVLLPVLNRPLLGLWLAQLEAAGFTRVAVNTHHLASLVDRFLASEGAGGLDLKVRHEPEISGTGGGLRKLGEILEEGPFLAVNGDILTDLNLAAIFRSHRPGAISTLVLHDCPPYNNVWVADGAVVSIGAPPAAANALPLAYTGVQVVSPKMLNYIPGDGYYDLVTAWREAVAAGERLDTLVVSGHFWQDLGTPAAYLTAHQRLLKGEAPGLAHLFPPLTDPLIGPGATIGPGVQFGGGVCLGAGVEIGAGAALTNTVVWDRAAIAPGVRLQDCLVALEVRVTHSAQGEVMEEDVGGGPGN
ncbi:MAG: sugar phosphate nucleotidyltransferase [Desulfobaccales bacterium]|nr:sugar phosphate nucleotidyltransferase [Desulfobaccales bacterium]